MSKAHKCKHWLVHANGRERSVYLLEEDSQRTVLYNCHRQVGHLLGMKQGLHRGHDLVKAASKTTQGYDGVYLQKNGRWVNK